MKYFNFLLTLLVGLTVCESRDKRCYLPIEVGTCKASTPKYGYDVATEKCMPFVYGGCQGNKNNFDSLEACQQACYANQDSWYRPDVGRFNNPEYDYLLQLRR